MTKKNRKKNTVQSVEQGTDGMSGTPIEADQANPKSEPADIDPGTQDVATENPKNEESGDEAGEAVVREGESESQEDDSIDDILDDVRHTLIEEEAGRLEKKPKWWNRLIKGTPSQATSDTELPDEVEMDVSAADTPPTVESDRKETVEYVEQIDELIKLLETDTVEDQEEISDVRARVVPPVEPDVRIDVDELKKQAFSPRPGDEKSDEYSEVRKVALGGEEDVFVEVESRVENPLDERIKAVENALRPYRTYIYYVLAFIGVIMAVMASVVMYNVYKQSLPEPEVTEVVILPYPVTLNLPGGLNFNLAKGALKDGEWDPRGPEWLEGTEICRWVAIPWSRQLEAAIRTMNRDDVLVLLMSNNDKLEFNVESIQELTPAEMQEMDANSPCLALILAKQDSEKRWVVIGRP